MWAGYAEFVWRADPAYWDTPLGPAAPVWCHTSVRMRPGEPQQLPRVRGRSWWNGVLTIAVIGFGAFLTGCTTNPSTVQRDASEHQAAVSSSTTTSSVPAVVTPCQGAAGPGPAPAASASAIEPLLLTAADVPPGYETTGPQVTPPSGPEFYGAIPPLVPVAYVAFSMNSNPGPAGVAQSQDGITEAVARASSPLAAAALVEKVNAVAKACGAGGNSVALPGSVPNLFALVTNGGTSSQSIATAEVFVVKGDYLNETRWFNTNLANASLPALPSPAPIPTPEVIGSVVDAALGRIPGSG